MKTIQTDDTNDMFLDENGNVAFCDNIDAVGQVVKNHLRTQLGELQYDITTGVPYLETIFKDNGSIELWKSYMIDEAQKVDNVLSVETIEITLRDTTLNYDMTIKTSYGEISVGG